MNINFLPVKNHITYLQKISTECEENKDSQISNPEVIDEKSMFVESKYLSGYYNITNANNKKLDIDKNIIANAHFEQMGKNGLTIKMPRKVYLKKLTEILENSEYKNEDKDEILKKIGITKIEGIIDFTGEITLDKLLKNCNNGKLCTREQKIYDLTENFKKNKSNKDEFIDNLNLILKNETIEYKKDILKQLGIQVKNGIIGYNGIINIQNLDINKKIEKDIYDLTNDFINNNEIQTPDEKLNNEINKILKVMPEFINIIGKQQHSFHDFSIDIHTLKVLQNIVTDERYKNLKPEDKQIIEYTALLHDIGKREIEESDNEHPKASAEISKNILENQNLSEDSKNKILNLIENHEWLYWYDDTRKSKKLEMDVTGRDILKKFSNNDELFKMAQILTGADIKGIKENTENQQIREWLYVLNNINENFYDLLDESYKIDTDVCIEHTPDVNVNSNTIKKLEGCHTSFLTNDELVRLTNRQKIKRVEKGINELANELRNMTPDELLSLDTDNPEIRNKILDIWAWRKYDENLNNNPELQEAYIQKFNEICDNNTISLHPNEVFIRTTPVGFEHKQDEKGYYIGKPTSDINRVSWPGAAARFKADGNFNIPECVIKRLIDDKLTRVTNDNADEKEGSESTIYVISSENGSEIRGFDWQKTGTINESRFGSHAFGKEKDENGYPTEVDFSDKVRFKLKKKVEFNLKTKLGTIPVYIVYLTPINED